MANARINALTEDTALVGTDWLVAEVGDSEARKVSVTTLKSAVSLFNAYALVRDEKANNTSGGSSVATTWNVRDLNTEVFDTGSFVSVASNQFTLAAGTYFIKAHAPTAGSGVGPPARTRLRLYNATDASVTAYGPSGYHNDGSNAQDVIWDTMTARVTIAGSKAFEIHQYTQQAVATEGLGVADNLSTNEIYTEVEIWRES